MSIPPSHCAGAGTGLASAADWTARVLVGGLKPARTYWYRFTDTDGNGSRSRPHDHRAVAKRSRAQ